MLSFDVRAEPDISFDLEKITIAVIEIHSHEGGGDADVLSVRKICLDGQAYLVPISIKGIVGISPAFKDGKPEKCRFLPDGKPVSAK